MISEIKANSIYLNSRANKIKNDCSFKSAKMPISNYSTSSISKQNVINQPITILNESDKKKYNVLLDFLKNAQISPNSDGLHPFNQLDLLLKNGKLLSKSNHDNSTTLDNLYEIAIKKRAKDLDSMSLITNTLDLLCNPRYVTQTFGDIPIHIQGDIVAALPEDNLVKSNPQLMNVYSSGTCPAASLEVNMADKYPAEFARWVNCLSSEKKAIELNVDLKAITKNPFEAMEILKFFETNKSRVDLNKAKLNLKLNLDAHIRACVQTKFWDRGERSVVDVLIQSAIMELGSKNTYNALSDTRAGDNPQGLIELEKTFAETLIKNKEITSLVYHQIDDDQNLIGYNCSLDKIAKHITDTIDSGDDVILGYVLTNETAGVTTSSKYNPDVDGAKNKVINGHEITVIDYYKDQNGKLMFICVDTDDDSPELVQYSEDWLLPKIHHAGYPARIVEADEAEIMKNFI